MTLTPEECASLRERLDRLPTPEESAQRMKHLQVLVAQVIHLCQELLDSHTHKKTSGTTQRGEVS